MRRVLCLPLVLATLLPACADEATSGDPEDGFVVPDGKEDDFLSLSAAEFNVEGTSTVTVEPGRGKDRALELVRLKHTAIAWFLNSTIVETEDEETHATSGVGAMVKTGRVEDLDLTQLDDTTWSFTFRQVVAGKRDLPRRLGVDARGEFTIQVGKPSNEEMAQLETNHEWYRSAPWDPWKPETVPADQRESLTLALSPEQGSDDAWFDYARLIEDRVLSIDVHFGWDYHDEFHLKHSRDLYRWLVDRGYRSPVSSYDKYTRTSGALKRTITANGKQVEVRVRLYWGKPGSSTDPDTDAGGKQLEADMRASLAKSDVIVYAGHSGSFYGFALANWKKTSEGDLDDSEMGTVEMPADRYQVVFAEGCDTLMIGPAFLDNVHKAGENLDVLTTTSFSNAAANTSIEFIRHLVELDSNGAHRPRTITALLRDLDPSAMYGVHGVDDNPQLHPYADTELLCESCGSNGDCGGPGNMCISIPDEGRHCAAACTTDAGCPDGYRCRKIASASSQTIFANMCVPAELSCEL